MITGNTIKTIALITHTFPPFIGGASNYAYELAKALSQKGYEVHVFAAKGASEDKDFVLHPVLTMDLRTDLNILKQFDFDIWHSLFFFYAPLAFYKKNVFVTGHGEDCVSFRMRFKLPGRLLSKLEVVYNRRIFASALKKARHLIAVSNFTKKAIIDKYNVPDSKISVISSGVRERFFKTQNAARQKNLLLTVARLSPADRIKNVHSVIKALSGLKDQYEFEYVIIGSARNKRYEIELVNLIKENGLQERIKLKGQISDEELAEYYQKAELFILAPYAEEDNFEGFGVVFLEANASGVPVLTSKEGGMTDYIVEGVNGYYTKNTTPEGIREAVKRFLDGKIKFDEKKIKQCPQEYRWDNIVERILETYVF